MTLPTERPRPRSPLDRFFGGPPLMVIFRLVLLCILVGVILKVLGLDPLNIIKSIEDLVRYVWNMGFDAVVWLWRYFLLGAVIVDPDLADRAAIRAPKGGDDRSAPTARAMARGGQRGIDRQSRRATPSATPSRSSNARHACRLDRERLAPGAR